MPRNGGNLLGRRHLRPKK